MFNIQITYSLNVNESTEYDQHSYSSVVSDRYVALWPCPMHTGLAQGFLVVGVNLHYKNLTITMKQKTKFLCR